MNFATLSAIGRPMSRSIMASDMSIPVETPAEVHSLPSTTNSEFASTETSGKLASASQLAQWVVTRVLLSIPREASMNAPEQTEPKRFAVWAHFGIHFCVIGCDAARNMTVVVPPPTKRVCILLPLTLESASVCRDTPQLLLIKPPPGDTITIL